MTWKMDHNEVQILTLAKKMTENDKIWNLRCLGQIDFVNVSHEEM